MGPAGTRDSGSFFVFDAVTPTSVTDTKQPLAFISYSWTTPEYAAQVEELARDLTRDGIHIVLDQWDLREGQNKHAFMERCVLDQAVERVLILIDPRYVDRADRREGGVGTETLIISSEVYSKVDQAKFIPVIMERNSSGEVTLPVYLKERIYIDLSDPSLYEEQYERLIRNIHGRPDKVRPPVGERPTFLNSDASRLSTGQALPMFKQALLQNKPNASGFLDEYLDRVATALENEKIVVPPTVEELEVLTSQSIDRFLPYRDEFVSMLDSIARYGVQPDLYGRLHAFFERVLSFRHGHVGVRWVPESEVENISFSTWELFLYTVGSLVRSRRFDGLIRLLEPYVVGASQGGFSTVSYTRIDATCRVLETTRQTRLGTRWKSAAGQLLRERLATGWTFEMLMEADSLLWTRCMLSDAERGNWTPRTAPYRESIGYEQLPLWVRTRGDPHFFALIAPLLGVTNREDALNRIAKLDDGPYYAPGYWSLGRNTLARLMEQSR